MNVEELIEYLQQFPKDMKVLIERSDISTVEYKHRNIDYDQTDEMEPDFINGIELKYECPMPSDMDKSSIRTTRVRKAKYINPPSLIGLSKEAIEYVKSQPREHWVVEKYFTGGDNDEEVLLLS